MLLRWSRLSVGRWVAPVLFWYPMWRGYPQLFAGITPNKGFRAHDPLRILPKKSNSDTNNVILWDPYLGHSLAILEDILRRRSPENLSLMQQDNPTGLTQTDYSQIHPAPHDKRRRSKPSALCGKSQDSSTPGLRALWKEGTIILSS